MIVTIFGATGMVGKKLITHCLVKGWQVRAFGRNIESMLDDEARNKNFSVIKGYVFDEHEVRQAIEGSDAVLSSLGGALDGADKARSLGMKNIIHQMEAAKVSRIVVLGGLGVLPSHDGGFLLDDDDYPQEFLPVGIEHKKAFQYLESSSLKWTFVCSPNILPLPADNQFAAAANEPGPSNEINAGNLALFMVNELTANHYVRQRVGIGNLPAEG